MFLLKQLEESLEAEKTELTNQHELKMVSGDELVE